ncbi:MAG: hypothetical protein K8S54_13455 [Spirochaetia bacterium]|nr:hypothetical protein [Spirochaetia bacterium]
MKLLVGFCLVLLGSCRLFQHTDLSGRDPATRTIFIHNFTNQTFEPDVNAELTEWLKREIGRRDNFKLAKTREEARLWLYGDIIIFSKEGRMYDNFHNPVRYEVISTARVKFRENPAKAPPDRVMDKAGEVSGSIQYSEKEGYTEPEFQARQRLMRILASKISDALESEYLAWYP